MESEDRKLIEKRLDEISGYLLANIYFATAVAARIIPSEKQLVTLVDDLEAVIRELGTGRADEDPHLIARNDASKLYLHAAINDIEQKYLYDESATD